MVALSLPYNTHTYAHTLGLSSEKKICLRSFNQLNLFILKKSVKHWNYMMVKIHSGKGSGTQCENLIKKNWRLHSSQILRAEASLGCPYRVLRSVSETATPTRHGILWWEEPEGHLWSLYPWCCAYYTFHFGHRPKRWKCWEK